MIKKFYIIILVVLFWATSSLAAEVYITKYGYVGASSLDMMEMVVLTLLDNDKSLFSSLVDSSKDVYPLKGGMEVHIVEEAAYKNQLLIRIRQIGGSKSVWTLPKAVYVKDSG